MVRVEAGRGEELLTDVLDLDAVTRVRELGTAGVSRMWEQIDSGAASERRAADVRGRPDPAPPGRLTRAIQTAADAG